MAPFGGLSWSANADLVRQTSGFTLSLQPSPFIRTWDWPKVEHIYTTSGLGFGVRDSAAKQVSYDVLWVRYDVFLKKEVCRDVGVGRP